MQHNIRSISAIYRNIALPELAALLGLPEGQVETLTAAMLMEGRLSGHIDQVWAANCAGCGLTEAGR